MGQKRLRIFAGPNGSGKSSIYESIKNRVNLGVFVNADQIEAKLKSDRCLDLSYYNIIFDLSDFKEQLRKSTFLEHINEKQLLANIAAADNILIINDLYIIDSYLCAFISDYLRTTMLDCVDVFSVETVMSHKSKIEYIELAKSKGYKIYLYFVATKSPLINIYRVKRRFAIGGHDVPEEKIIERYFRSMDLLYDAAKLSDRTYFFDNSDIKYQYIGSYEGGELNINNDIKSYPDWIDKYFISKKH